MTNRPKQKRSFRQRPQIPPGPGKKPLPKYGHGPFSWLVIGLVALSVLLVIGRVQGIEEVGYSDFENYRDNGYIESVKLRQNKIIGKFTKEYINERGGRAGGSFEVYYYRELYPIIFSTGYGKKKLSGDMQNRIYGFRC